MRQPPTRPRTCTQAESVLSLYSPLLSYPRPVLTPLHLSLSCSLDLSRDAAAQAKATAPQAAATTEAKDLLSDAVAGRVSLYLSMSKFYLESKLYSSLCPNSICRISWHGEYQLMESRDIEEERGVRGHA